MRVRYHLLAHAFVNVSRMTQQGSGLFACECFALANAITLLSVGTLRNNKILLSHLPFFILRVFRILLSDTTFEPGHVDASDISSKRNADVVTLI